MSRFVTDSGRFGQWLLAANVCLVDNRLTGVPAEYEVYRSDNIEAILKESNNPLYFAKVASSLLGLVRLY